MKLLVSISFLSILLSICPFGHASPSSVDLDSIGALPSFERPGGGGSVVDYAMLGRLTARILEGQDTPELGHGDRAAILASFLRVWNLKPRDKDSPLEILDQHLTTIRTDSVFTNFPEDRELRKAFANLRIAFLAVDAHRGLTSLEENEPVRTAFAYQALKLIIRTFEHRAKHRKKPTNDQVIALLSRTRAEGGPGSQVIWWKFVDILRREIDDALDGTMENSYEARTRKGVLVGLSIGSTISLLSAITGFVQGYVDQHYGAWGATAVLTAGGTGSLVGAFAAMVSQPFERKAIAAEAAAFVDECHAALVQ